MTKYRVIKTNPTGIESTIVIEAESLTVAETLAQEFVSEYNNLGNGHEDNWVLKSVTAVVNTSPPSGPLPEPIIEAPPRDPE